MFQRSEKDIEVDVIFISFSNSHRLGYIQGVLSNVGIISMDCTTFNKK
nr:MAG: hypothetical protein [Bacteriophage sp.]